MHQSIILLVILFFMLIIGYGCLTVGKRFYSDDLSWIVNKQLFNCNTLQEKKLWKKKQLSAKTEREIKTIFRNSW